MSVSINHVLLLTQDVDGMAKFFEQALELKAGQRPPFNFPGAWLWNDSSPIIHLGDEK